MHVLKSPEGTWSTFFMQKTYPLNFLATYVHSNEVWGGGSTEGANPPPPPNFSTRQRRKVAADQQMFRWNYGYTALLHHACMRMPLSRCHPPPPPSSVALICIIIQLLCIVYWSRKMIWAREVIAIQAAGYML